MDDAGLWTAPEWTTKTNKKTCQPTIDDNARMKWTTKTNTVACHAAIIDADADTVTNIALHLPDCAFESNQKAEGIQYILKISAEKTTGDSDTDQLRAYDHLYNVMCNYDNTGRTSGSFVPIKNQAANDTGM